MAALAAIIIVCAERASEMMRQMMMVAENRAADDIARPAGDRWCSYAACVRLKELRNVERITDRLSNAVVASSQQSSRHLSAKRPEEREGRCYDVLLSRRVGRGYVTVVVYESPSYCYER